MQSKVTLIQSVSFEVAHFVRAGGPESRNFKKRQRGQQIPIPRLCFGLQSLWQRSRRRFRDEADAVAEGLQVEMLPRRNLEFQTGDREAG